MRYEVADSADAQCALRPHLNALFLDCFKKPFSVESWRHLYMSAPTGPALSVTAWDEQGLVGHYAVAPFPVENALGTRLTLARGMTLAIAERGRRFGVLGELLKIVRQELSRRGIPATIGFPNELSWRPLVLLGGWKILFESPMLQFDVPTATARTSIEETLLPAPGAFAPPYTDVEFMTWRGGLSKMSGYVIDGRLAVISKILNGNTLDVMDAWPLEGAPEGTELHALARHLGLAHMSATAFHANLAGLDSSLGNPTGYTVRQGIMPHGEQPAPDLAFSLVFSDVF